MHRRYTNRKKRTSCPSASDDCAIKEEPARKCGQGLNLDTKKAALLHADRSRPCKERFSHGHACDFRCRKRTRRHCPSFGPWVWCAASSQMEMQIPSWKSLPRPCHRLRTTSWSESFEPRCLAARQVQILEHVELRPSLCEGME